MTQGLIFFYFLGVFVFTFYIYLNVSSLRHYLLRVGRQEAAGEVPEWRIQFYVNLVLVLYIIFWPISLLSEIFSS